LNSDRNFGNRNPSASSGSSGKPQTNQNGQKKDAGKQSNDRGNKSGSDKPKYANKGSFSKNSYNNQNKGAYVIEEFYPAENAEEFFNNGENNSQCGSPTGSYISNEAHLAGDEMADENSNQGSPTQHSETHSEN